MSESTVRENSETIHESELIRAPELIHTPGVRSIDQLVNHLRVAPQQIIKTLIYEADGRLIAVLVRGDYEANEIKVKNYLGVENLVLAEPEAAWEKAGARIGYAGPIGLAIPILADRTVASMPQGIAGANRADYHVGQVVPGRDFSLAEVGDFRNVTEGEICPRCGTGTLTFYKGIEVGHIFKLGTKYSEKLGAAYRDSAGIEKPIVMGCYGIGVSRLLSAVIEQHHDEQGIVWPQALAPFRVHLIPVSMQDETQIRIAELLYDRLREAGIPSLLDDRDERAGVKFKDSELIGIPLRIVIGKEAGDGRVEWAERRRNAKQSIDLEEVISKVLQFYS